MKRAILAALLLATATGLAQPQVDVAAALKAVTPDLDERLARFKPVTMPYNSAALSQRERDMVDQLVIALRELENMYWRQSDPEALALYNALEADATPLAQKLRHYLFINGSRFDLVDGNKPFIGTAPMPPGIDEMFLAGFLRKKPVEMVPCITQPELSVPARRTDQIRTKKCQGNLVQLPSWQRFA